MRNRQRGHAMIELAFSATVMVACLAGTFQFGYTFYVYNQLVTAVGNGGRYAATRTLRAETDKAEKAIRNMVVYGNPQAEAGSHPAVAGLTPENVEVRWVKDGSGAPASVSIAIREYPVNAIFRTFTFSGRPGVEFPYVGKYSPSEHEQ